MKEIIIKTPPKSNLIVVGGIYFYRGMDQKDYAYILSQHGSGSSSYVLVSLHTGRMFQGMVLSEAQVKDHINRYFTYQPDVTITIEIK